MAVFIDSKDRGDLNLFPGIVGGALGNPKMGRTIPKVIVTSPSSAAVWESLAYKEISERRLKKARKKVMAIASGKEVWNAKKKTIHAFFSKKKPGSRWLGEFVKLEGDYLSIVSPNGENISVKLDRLTSETVAYAKKLAGQPSGKSPANTEEQFESETWTSSGGKSIIATFLSLDRDKVMLRLDNGKVATLPLSRLSEASVARAKELGK